ncbi:MAG: RNB domain-containing ribonuclease [Geodermatophilaceae bacterium]
MPRPPTRTSPTAAERASATKSWSGSRVWESRHVNPEGQIVEVLGAQHRSRCRHAFDHPEVSSPRQNSRASVIAEAEQIPETVELSTSDGREDLRDQFIVTIDPDDARDFDDAINVERLNGGGWRLGVHIADVAAYVLAPAASSIAKR